MRAGTSRRGWALALLLAVTVAVGLAVWLARWSSGSGQLAGDSYLYARLAYHFDGDPDPLASRHAAAVTCRWQHHAHQVPVWAEGHPCDQVAAPAINARYQAIFRDRVGGPWLVSRLFAVLGTSAFPVATAAAAMTAVAAFTLLLLAWTRSWLAAVAGGVLLVALPTGGYLARVASEAPALACALAAACGALLVLRSHRNGWVVLIVPLLLLVTVRPSDGLALSVLLLVAAGAGLAVTRRRAFAVVAAGTAVSTLFALAWLHWRHTPGIRTTLQDTFTRHFRSPDVADLRGHWQRLAADTFTAYAHAALHQPWWVLLGVTGVCAAVALLRWESMALLAMAGAGVASALVHPVHSEVPRLLLPAAPLVLAGLVVLVHRTAVRVVRARAWPEPAAVA